MAGCIGQVRSTIVDSLWFGRQTFWMLDGWRFGYMMALPVIWSCDRVVFIWWLLVTDGLQVWINVESSSCKRVSVVLLMVWYRVGVVDFRAFLAGGVLLPLWVLDSFLVFVFMHFYLLNCVFHLVLVFGFIFISQINPCSIESGLLS